MNHRPSRTIPPARALALAALAAAALAPVLQAQQPPAAAGPTAAEKYKNIQVLKDLPAAQLHDVMVYFEAATGGNCQSCHVRGADGEFAYERDDSDRKVAARRMVEMVRVINTQHFKGEERVTCATCHQARREPSPLVPLSQPMTPDQLAAMPAPRPAGAPGAEAGRGEGGRAQGGPPPAGAPGQQAGAPPRGEGGQGPGGRAGQGGGRGPQRPTETVDQVLDKFVQALGGRDALQKITTRTRRGILTNRANQTSPITVEDTAAGQYRATVEGTPATSTRAWDGKAAWSQAGNRIRDFEGIEATNISLPADLALPLSIKDSYSALGVQAYARIAGHDVIVLQGRRSAGVAETLMFDRTSGLLVRRIARLKTPMGELPVQIDYADYRPNGGVQTPYEMHVADWESVSVMKFTDVVLNQPIDAARFARPAAQPGR